MEKSNHTEDNLNNEFRNLGKNLVEAIHAAWENPERKKLQQDIESGLSELGGAVKSEIEKIQTSSTGQQIKSDLEDLQSRIKDSEIESKIREDLIKTLKAVNMEITKLSEKWKTSHQESADETPDDADNSEIE